MNRAFLTISVVLSCLCAFFAQSTGKLHTARFARLHEILNLLISKARALKKAPVILVGLGPFDQAYGVRPTTEQKELGNVLLLGKTRTGKGLNIVTNLLTWPFPVVVHDIKRELWDATAGWRERGLGGRCLMFDPRGAGNRYDPFAGKTTDSDLRSAATLLLHRPNEGQNAVFTERAVTMLTQIFHAAILEGQRALPFTYKILNEGLYATATILKIISDKHHFYQDLATKFLDIPHEKADFDSKFLQDCYSTMTARINNILTHESVRCFTGSDFTGRDIITSGRSPVSLYLCWPEKDLLSLSPLIQLVYDSLINDMTEAYDSLKGEGCTRTLLVLDEIFRSGMAKLPQYSTTVCGRHISILLTAQSRAQLDAEYGRHKADILRGQIDTIVLHRPAPDDYETMAHIEKILGYTSGFAHSKNEHDGATSRGESEQRIPLIPAHEMDLMKATEVIIKRSGVRPVLANRLDWRAFPELAARHEMATPQIAPIPGFDQPFTQKPEYALASGSSWRLTPELTRRGRPVYAGNGFTKRGRGDA